MIRIASLAFMGLVVAWAGRPSSAVAGLSEWFTETAVSDDGRYILVTISDRPLDVELADDRLNSAEKEQVKYVRALYPRCGLYLNDGSNTPLWIHDGRWSSNPIIAPDGEHVIFPGPWTWSEYELRAVEFTRRGRTIRSYNDDDFIPAWWLKFLVSGRRGPNCEGYWFNPVKMSFTIRTTQREEFVFDVRTGAIIETQSPFPIYFSIVGIAVVTLVVAAIYTAHRKRAMNAN